MPASPEDAELARRIRSLTHSLDDLGITVSTGSVVDFRRAFIHQEIDQLVQQTVFAAQQHGATTHSSNG